MDAADEQQHKEFLSSLFTNGLSVDQVQRELDAQQGNSQGIFPFNNGSSNLATPSPGQSDAQFNMDLLGNLMQAIDPKSAAQQSQYNPHVLLEHQFKLNQLQQLQQLQNQIFQ